MANDKFNQFESIADYFGEPCIYASWDDENSTELQLLCVDGSYATPYGNIIISDDDVNDWEMCDPGDDIIKEIKDWFVSNKDENAEEDDYTSRDVDNAVAFFWHKSNEQYILVLNR